MPPASTRDNAMPFDASEVAARLEFAIAIARAAGGQAVESFRSGRVAVERKADGSEVTAADREGERLMRARLARDFPGDAILGEEGGATEGRSGYRWLL